MEIKNDWFDDYNNLGLNLNNKMSNEDKQDTTYATTKNNNKI